MIRVSSHCSVSNGCVGLEKDRKGNLSLWDTVPPVAALRLSPASLKALLEKARA